MQGGMLIELFTMICKNEEVIHSITIYVEWPCMSTCMCRYACGLHVGTCCVWLLIYVYVYSGKYRPF